MTKKIAQASAVAAIIAAAIIAGPTAVQAAVYPPANAVTASSVTVAPGGSVFISAVEGTFSPTEPVTITITGDGGADATVGMVKFVVGTATGSATSTASGALPSTRITFPAHATGSHTIAAFSATSAGDTVTISIVGSASSPGDVLSETGGDGNVLLAAWIGGGAIVLGGAALAVAASVRRQRKQQAA